VTEEDMAGIVDLVKAICPAQRFEEMTPDAWMVIFGGLPVADVLIALENLGRRLRFIAPADIWQEVAILRGHRIDDVGLKYSGNPDETTEEYLAGHRGRLAAAADGRIPAARDQLALGRRPVAALVASVPPPPGVREAVNRSRTRRGPLSVRCPYPSCHAAVGSPCSIGGKISRSGFYHPSRIEASRGEAA